MSHKSSLGNINSSYACYQMDESNAGGVGAKKGFYFQDYVATLLASEMLVDSDITGIGCEVGDDVEIFNSDNSVIHVQVKTGTVSNLWSLKELKAPRNFTSNKKPKPKSSILHKSLEFDKEPNIVSKFMIVTDKAVNSSLSFLEILHKNRERKTGREALIKSVDSALGKTFISKNGNKGEYWVDNTLWRVFANTELLVLKSENLLRVACEELFGATLSVESIKQLGEVLCNRIYQKSQLSKKTHSVTDKVLSRKEALELLRSFIFTRNTTFKAYPERQLPKIVVPLFDILIDKHKRKGFIQNYNFNMYRYDHIVEMLIGWIDEVFLHPAALIGSKQTLKEAKELSQKISELDLRNVISRIILNSILRTQSQSQPIPMIMFAASNSKYIKFDSVHIVSNENEDELWIGITEFIQNSDDIFEVMDKLCSRLNDLVFIDMDTDRKIILESKDNKYLYKHNIDQILDTSNSFSEHVNRFKFVIFISYQFSSYDHDTSEDSIKREIQSKIEYMYQSIIKKNQFFSTVRLGFYVFPTPCNDTIINKFKDKFSS
jgi:hypothetical protein